VASDFVISSLAPWRWHRCRTSSRTPWRRRYSI
jgi:hypothetical protein